MISRNFFQDKSSGGGRRKQMGADDEIRLLHEAYQFLIRKYKLGSMSESTMKKEDMPDESLMNKEVNDEDDDVFGDAATKSEDEDFEREMKRSPKSSPRIRRVNSSSKLSRKKRVTEN